MENKTNVRDGKKKKRTVFSTHSGHALTPLEAEFINLYIETGNGRQSVLKAGYKTRSPAQYAQRLLNKTYINEEINYRLEKMKSEKIANATEIMEYFSAVMRGEIKDQFGLDAPLSERTRAAQELAKRKIDIVNKSKDDGDIVIKLIK